VAFQRILDLSKPYRSFPQTPQPFFADTSFCQFTTRTSILDLVNFGSKLTRTKEGSDGGTSGIWHEIPIPCDKTVSSFLLLSLSPACCFPHSFHSHSFKHAFYFTPPSRLNRSVPIHIALPFLPLYLQNALTLFYPFPQLSRLTQPSSSLDKTPPPRRRWTRSIHPSNPSLKK